MPQCEGPHLRFSQRMISLIVVLKTNQSDYFKDHCH